MAQLKTFLFTDICRSVDLKNEMVGRSIDERDLAFIQSILMPHREQIEVHLEEFGGRVVSTAGDGHFLVFESSIQASLWAVEVQRSHAATPINTPGGGRVEVRMSIHVGVPQVDPTDETNFIGKSVDYASRLNDYATGEQILVSRSVMAILDDIGLDGISFHLHGRRLLKGIGRVEVHELLYDGHQPLTMRNQPKSHSDREWLSVNPALEFEPTVPVASGPSVASAPAAPSRTLQRIGNYELQELLGSGGMGDVYKGRHVQFNRIRAIKVIKQQFVASNNQDVIRRFYQEIKAIGALEHKNIVVAIDSSSQDDDTHYLVMEHVEGMALHELVMQHGPLSAADASEVVRQAARGLQYIHLHDMVHRDIKPSNLMLTLVDGDGVSAGATSIARDSDSMQGVIKILDLGLALLAGDNQERLTQYDNKAMGTGMYMSPEQWKTTSVDIRADIYSLGCTLYHLLAGDPPFYDSDLRQEKAHEKSNVPPIRSGEQIPPELWEVLQKMLAKNPDDRYATPAEVEEAIAPLAEGHDLVALSRSFVAEEASAPVRRMTRSNSGPHVDTWWSRTSSKVLTRRWMFRWALPMALVSVVVGGMYWTLQETKKSFIASAEESARENLPFIANSAVNDYIGKRITKRFDILATAAKDPELVMLINNFNALLPKGEISEEDRKKLAKNALQGWILQRWSDHESSTPAKSWFINNLQGMQIARSPISDEGEIVKSFLKDYSYRNYFHGEGKDRNKEEVSDVVPIDAPNLSAVYESSSDQTYRVAFSVPIWDTATEGKPAVIGVLSMSVNLGGFVAVNRDFDGKRVVLVDMRNDYLEIDPNDSEKKRKLERSGLVLQHTKLPKGVEKGNLHRIDPELLQKLESFSESTAESDDRFMSGYRDSLVEDSKVLFWGVFKPVVYSIRDSKTSKQREEDSGWIVIAQEEISGKAN